MFLDCKQGAVAAGTTMTGTVVIGYNGAVSMGANGDGGYSLMLAQYPFMERKQQFSLQLPRF
jgi:hypothetical protein